MTDYVVAEQEIAAHVFVPLDGTPSDTGRTTLAGVWDRFRRHQEAHTSVFQALPVEFPAGLPRAPLDGSLPLAAVQSADGLDQAVLRLDQDVLNVSLLLGAAPDRTWPDLERRVERIVGPVTSARVGAVTLLLGKAPVDGADVLRPASPRPAHDTDPVRRLRMLVPAGHDNRLGAWAWSADGGPEMPPFIRYLMHTSVLRYQLAVYGRLRGDWSTSTGTAPRALIRVPFATAAGYRELSDPVEQLHAMRRCVDAAWDNALQALGRWRDTHGAEVAGTEVLDDDRALAAWFTRTLEDTVVHAELGLRQPAPPDTTAPRDTTAPDPRDLAAADTREEPGPSEHAEDDAPECNEDDEDDEDVRVLAVADEWFPANGGLSTLNRLLCAALARAGADVTVLVVTSDEEERADARDLGVRLLDTGRPGHSGREALMRRPPLPAGWVPDLIIGHGRVSGSAARAQAEDHFPGVKRLQVLHVEPEQAEWNRAARPEGDVGALVDERTTLELELCRGAWRTVAIGPRLWATLIERRRVPGFGDLGPPLRIDPGFDAGPTAQGPPPSGTVPRILILGRLKDETIKGLDIACRAVGRAVPEQSRPGRWQLVVRGAQDGQSAELHARASDWVNESAVDVSVLPYIADPRRIAQEVAGAALVLMPSRAEAFGLVGLEAVIAGVPVLVSGRSGLGMLLHATLPAEEAERVVIRVDAGRNRIEQDVDRWARVISSVMYDLPGAFVRAGDLRKRMADRMPWSTAADRVLRCRHGMDDEE
ncbi:CATRA conflict system CASPASE/TPR repeat-associated protein [Streptomyces sp. NPDC086549]|uniref:CATRA conflict system CASPASE/TPR repeat-associated protein n=1 Tax=Streptomyces sp. NPDC086549 TaxID=3365752 RepID=UPI00380F41E8